MFESTDKTTASIQYMENPMLEHLSAAQGLSFITYNYTIIKLSRTLAATFKGKIKKELGRKM